MQKKLIQLTTIPLSVNIILRELEKHTFDAYIVGGAVRDVLVGKQTTDWDFTTNATPEQIQKLFHESFYDNQFGTVGIAQKHLIEQFPELNADTTMNPEEVFEITTYRSEGIYKDHRRPTTVTWGKSIEEDLQRRDFTINAMALRKVNEETYELIDLFNGQRDLEDKMIRTVGNAEERFSEDALRMMRAIRFGAQLGFGIGEQTLAAVQKHAALIKEISWERIRDEFLKILISDFPKDGITLLYTAGLLQHILPELIESQGQKQSGHHIYDVWTHTLNAVQTCPSKDPVVRFAALMHDIAKPRTARITPSGSVTFYGHEVVGARMAKEIAQRFKLSNKEIDRIFTLVRWHMFVYDKRVTDAYIRRFIKRVGFENIPDMIALRISDRLGSGSTRTSWRLEEMKERIESQLHPPFSMKDMAVNGEDIMKELKLKPGKKVGEILHTLFHEVEIDETKNTRKYLIKKILVLHKQ